MLIKQLKNVLIFYGLKSSSIALLGEYCLWDLWQALNTSL